MKHVHIMCGKNVGILNLKPDCTQSNQGSRRLNETSLRVGHQRWSGLYTEYGQGTILRKIANIFNRAKSNSRRT